MKGTKRKIPEEEYSEDKFKVQRVSSDTEETDAYSESESHTSQEETAKKDSNENHILPTEKTISPKKEKDNNGYMGICTDNDLPVDLSNHKSKTVSCDSITAPDKMDTNGFIGHHFLQKPYTVNRNAPNGFSFKPKKRSKKISNILKTNGVISNGICHLKSEYDFNE